MKVKWNGFTTYTSSVQIDQPKGEGELINFIPLNGEAIGVVQEGLSFVMIPRIFLSVVTEKYSMPKKD